jgi:hypothetical protein
LPVKFVIKKNPMIVMVEAYFKIWFRYILIILIFSFWQCIIIEVIIKKFVFDSRLLVFIVKDVVFGEGGYASGYRF